MLRAISAATALMSNESSGGCRAIGGSQESNFAGRCRSVPSLRILLPFSVGSPLRLMAANTAACPTNGGMRFSPGVVGA